ncbi:MAG: hypothetical protein HOP29_13545 [Phycisphaerales bacterium]|nr:hypothetical protein [Phycisphaerales bacterium]
MKHAPGDIVSGRLCAWFRARRSVGGWTVLAAGVLLAVMPVHAQQVIRPVKDGTILDTGADGVPDTLDATFNNSTPGFEGAITLIRGVNAREIRVFWEYNLAAVTMIVPVSAKLTLTLRGAPIFPLPPATVRVAAYPSDLLESLADFGAVPESCVGVATVEPFQEPTDFTIDVSGVVNDALASGLDRAAFRFQIESGAPGDVYQAFIDAVDSDPATKPVLTLRAATSLLRHDYDVDGDVDLGDFQHFDGCSTGVGGMFGPGCRTFDADVDSDIDVLDFGDFQRHFTN